MNIKVEKELFQWEKGRYVLIEDYENEPAISCVQFYNKKSNKGTEAPIIDGKSKIPNFLLKEAIPITAAVCTNSVEGALVISRKEFKVLARPKPETYVDDDDERQIIYDGGVEV